MRFGIYLVCAGGAEAACATLCFGEGGGFLEHSGQVWCNDQLCNALPVDNRLRSVGVVVQGNQKFATVVGVDDTNLIGRCQAFFGSQAAAGVNQTHIAYRQFHRQTGVNQNGFPRRNGYVAVGYSVQVSAGGLLGTLGGNGCTRVQFFNGHSCSLHSVSPLSSFRVHVQQHRMPGC